MSGRWRRIEEEAGRIDGQIALLEQCNWASARPFWQQLRELADKKVGMMLLNSFSRPS